MWLKWPSQDKLGIKCPPTSFCQLLQSTYLTRQAMVYFIFFLLRNISRITLPPGQGRLKGQWVSDVHPLPILRSLKELKASYEKSRRWQGWFLTLDDKSLGRRRRRRGQEKEEKPHSFAFLTASIALLFSEMKTKLETKWNRNDRSLEFSPQPPRFASKGNSLHLTIKCLVK